MYSEGSGWGSRERSKESWFWDLGSGVWMLMLVWLGFVRFGHCAGWMLLRLALVKNSVGMQGAAADGIVGSTDNIAIVHFSF